MPEGRGRKACIGVSARVTPPPVRELMARRAQDMDAHALEVERISRVKAAATQSLAAAQEKMEKVKARVGGLNEKCGCVGGGHPGEDGEGQGQGRWCELGVWMCVCGGGGAPRRRWRRSRPGWVV